MQRMDANAQAMKAGQEEMRGEMQNMGISLQTQINAGQEEIKADLAKVKGEMQSMNRKMPN